MPNLFFTNLGIISNFFVLISICGNIYYIMINSTNFIPLPSPQNFAYLVTGGALFQVVIDMSNHKALNLRSFTICTLTNFTFNFITISITHIAFLAFFSMAMNINRTLMLGVSGVLATAVVFKHKDLSTLSSQCKQSIEVFFDKLIPTTS